MPAKHNIYAHSQVQPVMYCQSFQKVCKALYVKVALFKGTCRNCSGTPSYNSSSNDGVRDARVYQRHRAGIFKGRARLLFHKDTTDG